IFWGCNPAVSHPRHLARYSLPPRRRRDRIVVVVDVRATASAQLADLFLRVRPGADFEVLTVLRVLVQGKEIKAEMVGGVPTARLLELAERMKNCRFGVAFVGLGLTMSRGRDLNVSELFTLVAELNQHTRFSVIPMRGHGNVTGADQVLAWQSGYPFAVNFARGYPRYGPGEFSAVDVLARGEADTALVIASDPVAHFPQAAARQLERIPTIVLGPAVSLTAQAARVVLPTACCGMDAPGTFYRMDGVPIRMRPPLPSVRPTDEQVLSQIAETVKRC
ncbi:MAG: formylmethanofuran dehydrogenase subunit B, partial [Chloroflexi bacterium]|nr:formylmethanofuran dehydrogenase subunit B [Chloroflexota bacterium]